MQNKPIHALKYIKHCCSDRSGKASAFATGGTNDTGDSWTGAYDVSCGPASSKPRRLCSTRQPVSWTSTSPDTAGHSTFPCRSPVRSSRRPSGARCWRSRSVRPSHTGSWPAASASRKPCGPWLMRTARTRSRSSSPATASSAATVR